MKLVVADLNNRTIFRPIDEIYGEYNTNDTGLCNRLLCWELLMIINHIHDNKFEIIIDDQQNPETNNCFQLENTTVTDARNIDFDEYLPITDEMVQNIINGKYKLEDGNYYTDFTKRHINDFKENYSKRFINTLKFKHNDINNDIKDIVSDSIGIHIRRGRGVRIHKDNSIDLNLFEGWNHEILSEYIRMKIKNMPAWKFFQWDFIKDDVYFEIMDNILKKSPNQKFYISHDLKYEHFERWVERYPNNLIFKNQFYELLSNWEIPIELHTKNFLDLYCLCNTKEIFRVPSSTWSDLASDYNGKTGIYIEFDSMEEMLDKVYQKSLI